MKTPFGFPAPRFGERIFFFSSRPPFFFLFPIVLPPPLLRRAFRFFLYYFLSLLRTEDQRPPLTRHHFSPPVPFRHFFFFEFPWAPSSPTKIFSSPLLYSVEASPPTTNFSFVFSSRKPPQKLRRVSVPEERYAHTLLVAWGFFFQRVPFKSSPF